MHVMCSRDIGMQISKDLQYMSWRTRLSCTMVSSGESKDGKRGGPRGKASKAQAVRKDLWLWCKYPTIICSSAGDR